MKSVKHPTFPQKKCFFTGGGMLWKMQVREWAFAQVDVQDVAEGLNASSNNPSVAAGAFDSSEKGIKTTRAGSNVTVTFYANSTGFTFVHLFETDPFIAADDVRIQVEVLMRRAKQPAEISLTKLEGNTVVINAPDAKSYDMDRTITFSSTAINPLSVFAGVPSGTNHVVISSHGGVPTEADKSDNEKLCMLSLASI
jgi:hypothetical protein